jgi:hypothetical protein
MKNAYRIRGDYTLIYLKRKDGKTLVTIIDTEDLEKVKAIPNSWYACISKSKTYYVYGVLNGKIVALHRYVLNVNTPGMKIHVDHVNHNTLDNRKTKLRDLTPSGNHQNRNGASKHSKTGVRGVFWNKKSNKWEVQVRVKGKRVFYKKVSSRDVAERLAVLARQEFMPYSKDAAK